MTAADFVALVISHSSPVSNCVVASLEDRKDDLESWWFGYDRPWQLLSSCIPSLTIPVQMDMSSRVSCSFIPTTWIAMRERHSTWFISQVVNNCYIARRKQLVWAPCECAWRLPHCSSHMKICLLYYWISPRQLLDSLVLPPILVWSPVFCKIN